MSIARFGCVPGTHAKRRCRSALSLACVLNFMYEWAHESATIKRIEKECGIKNQQTICDWHIFLREICAQYFLENPVQISGRGHFVEIDESMFVRRKYNVGRTI